MPSVPHMARRPTLPCFRWSINVKACESLFHADISVSIKKPARAITRCVRVCAGVCVCAPHGDRCIRRIRTTTPAPLSESLAEPLTNPVVYSPVPIITTSRGFDDVIGLLTQCRGNLRLSACDRSLVSRTLKAASFSLEFAHVVYRSGVAKYLLPGHYTGPSARLSTP